MSVTKRQSRAGHGRHNAGGAFVVEFALVILVFFIVTFGVMELARLMYLFNTLQDVTRRAARAAATTDFTNAPAMDKVRQSAVFRTSSGVLVFGAPVRDDYVRIDYLALVQSGTGLTLTPIAGSALPSSPAQNRLNCVSNPNGANCISFVRVRICAPGGSGACNAVNYVPILPLIDLTPVLPVSTTILKAETLGYVPGQPL